MEGRRRQGIQKKRLEDNLRNGQALSSPSPRLQWRTEKNGGNWVWSHLVPQRPQQLNDRWDEEDASSPYRSLLTLSSAELGRSWQTLYQQLALSFTITFDLFWRWSFIGCCSALDENLLILGEGLLMFGENLPTLGESSHTLCEFTYISWELTYSWWDILRMSSLKHGEMHLVSASLCEVRDTWLEFIIPCVVRFYLVRVYWNVLLMFVVSFIYTWTEFIHAWWEFCLHILG